MRETSHHERMVSTLIARFGHAYGRSDEKLIELRFAALVHDIGKAGLPQHIVDKAGPLSTAEYAVVQSHSILGGHLIGLAGYREQANWVRHHHERWDGNGYPDQLRDIQIPLESRMIAIADTFHALTAAHTYRDPVNTETALTVIAENSGTQFDPDLVQVFIGTFA
jgi:HD-GYP domain-containing protein (c-di-GMP phosphodiesterase class II)